MVEKLMLYFNQFEIENGQETFKEYYSFDGTSEYGNGYHGQRITSGLLHFSDFFTVLSINGLLFFFNILPSLSGNRAIVSILSKL